MKILLILFAFFISIQSQSSTVRVALENKPWEPYYYGTKKIESSKSGIMIELLKMVEKNIRKEEAFKDFKFKFKRVPWKRCLSLLKKNKVEALLGASFKEKRRKNGEYPMNGSSPDKLKGIANASYSFYKMKGSSIKWDGKDFVNLKPEMKIGVTLGYSIIDFLKEKKIETFEARLTTSTLKMLLKKKVVGFAGFTDIVDPYLKESQYSEIVKDDIPLKEKTYYLMLSKKIISKNKALSERIWEEIKNVRGSKEYSELERKYREQ